MTFKAQLSACLDLLYPRHCIITGDIVSPGPYRYFSQQGLQQIEFIEPPACQTCGSPFGGIVSATRQCPHCLALDPYFTRGLAVFKLGHAGKRIIHALKYEQALYLLPDIKHMLTQSPRLSKFLKQATLVPVPLHPRKERERGYNQSLLIAKAFASTVPGCRVESILSRVKDTPSQTRMSQTERRSNISGAFQLSKPKQFLENKHYIIIDDVFTTGSTINECCKVLCQAGIENIDIATLGHG